MDIDTFDGVVNKRLSECTELMVSKSDEYAREKDKLHNFKRAGQITDQTPEAALVGMYVKHLTSVLDIVEDISSGKVPTKEMLAEKMNDSINYHLLLEALILERITPEDRCIICGANWADEPHDPSCHYAQ